MGGYDATSVLGREDAALSLARTAETLVFEQHQLPGGYSQSFSLEGFRFRPAHPYIGRPGCSPATNLKDSAR